MIAISSMSIEFIKGGAEVCNYSERYSPQEEVAKTSSDGVKLSTTPSFLCRFNT